MNNTLYTIGFTKKKAEKFFELIKKNNIKYLVDIRLNNVSQLAGFAKRDDLKYFLKQICNCEYRHMPEIAPTKEILDGYKKKQISWDEYVVQYNTLIKKRIIESKLSLSELDGSCFLCSEPTADMCHRRLAAEYLKKQYKELKIKHL
ncbi:MAG: DUF488 domain-containing protein [Desulfobacula sp.]|uniref:DUF488 domain-containing protein n=1 Tax=Desulfobacula sp. TaxID=2593537 RepID=UPI001D297F4F|nr:DUF488 domain-containing protein [Desulfobacula sp.]MBT3486799.1 DUF488 domain-containing protein [Desulfobacula sp.]MBT3806472.1 DUF488 domain-containing protein [Desulfobacula sp.]MBT4026419.1 DUF488 domain-containing protein [Desulfobacula sp.]MBT4876761.1 DUF488 domain-containing protein [Desulfobacula sp.]